MDVPFILARIVTCYKQWDLILKWIENDLLFKDEIEWIIVNDCPTDICPKELEKTFFEKKIKLLTPLLNIGRCGARNWATRETNAYWIEHIDGDDIPLPINTEDLELHHDVDLISFPVEGYDSKTDFNKLKIKSHNFPWKVNLDHYEVTAPLFHPIDWRPVGILWKRNSFLNLQGYDARYDDSYEDMQLTWRAHHIGYKIGHLDKPKQLFFCEIDSGLPAKMTSISTMRYWQYLEKFGQKEDREYAKSMLPIASKVLLWEAYRQLKIQHADSLFFRIKEAIKLVLRRY